MTYDYDSIPVGHYDRIYTARKGVQSKWHHMKFARVREAIAGSGRHLDIGCGPGTFIGSLPSGTHDSTGIDVAEAQIAYAEARYGGSGRAFRTVPPGPLPFADGTFDVVTSVELIEHLCEDDGLAFLREALRVLRPGGHLLVTTPNYASAWPLVERLVNRLGGIDYSQQHISHYDRHTLVALFARAGADDVRVRGYMLLAPFAAALSWKLADAVVRCEPACITDRFGLLLLAAARKP